MSKSRVLVTVTADSKEALEDLQLTVKETLARHSEITIENSNIEENFGMGRKDIVLSFLISVSANFAYDGLAAIIENNASAQGQECTVEVLELSTDTGDDESVSAPEDKQT